MSIGTIQDIVAYRPEYQINEPVAGRHDSSGLAFKDLLAVSAAGTDVTSGAGRKAAKTAEILHLEMVRNALSLDGTAPPSTSAVGGGRLNNLLAAYGIEGQNTGMTAEKTDATEAPEAPEAETNVSILPAPVPAPPIAAQGSGASGLATLISRASRRYGVDEGLIKAVIQAESNFKTTAVSSAGAQGLMQLMPATAAGLGVTDSFNPEQNVMAGTRFLKDLLNRYGGDVDKALAAYNWGPGNVDKGKSRLPQETRDYLVKVKKLYSSYSTA